MGLYRVLQCFVRFARDNGATKNEKANDMETNCMIEGLGLRLSSGSIQHLSTKDGQGRIIKWSLERKF